MSWFHGLSAGNIRQPAMVPPPEGVPPEVPAPPVVPALPVIPVLPALPVVPALPGEPEPALFDAQPVPRPAEPRKSTVNADCTGTLMGSPLRALCHTPPEVGAQSPLASRP